VPLLAHEVEQERASHVVEVAVVPGLPALAAARVEVEDAAA
jgi:hypothetical protein